MNLAIVYEMKSVHIDCSMKMWQFNVKSESIKLQFTVNFVNSIQNDSTVHIII